MLVSSFLWHLTVAFDIMESFQCKEAALLRMSSMTCLFVNMSGYFIGNIASPDWRVVRPCGHSLCERRARREME